MTVNWGKKTRRKARRSLRKHDNWNARDDPFGRISRGGKARLSHSQKAALKRKQEGK